MSLKIHTEDDVAALNEATVLIEISTRRHGNTATVDASQFKDTSNNRVRFASGGSTINDQAGRVDFVIDIDQSMIAVRKKLLDSPQLAAVKAFDQETYRMIAKHAVKGRLKNSVYRVPLSLLNQTEELLQGRAKMRAGLVSEFMACLEPLQREASAKLGCVYREADYPDDETVESHFAFEWRYFAQEVPNRLFDAAPLVAMREVGRARDDAEAELESIRRELRAGLAELLFKLLERLTPDEEGKPKRFEFTTIENLREFLEIFHARNLARDSALASVVEAATVALDGINPHTIRGKPEDREKLKRALEEMDEQMSQLLPAPTIAAIREKVAPKPAKRKIGALPD